MHEYAMNKQFIELTLTINMYIYIHQHAEDANNLRERKY